MCHAVTVDSSSSVRYKGTIGDSVSVGVGGLVPHTKYAFAVKAFNAEGEGPLSSPVEGRTAEDSESFLQLLLPCRKKVRYI